MNKKFYNLVLHSRRIQLEVNNNLKDKKIKVPVHLAIGHEYVAALVKYNFMPKNDKIILTHRNIHFTSLFSKNPKKIYLEFTNKNIDKLKTFGSMNYYEKNSDIAYTSSILGNNFSVACGVAKALKKKKGITICTTGDGAIEEGSFYESLLLAKYLELPIIFLIENNDWSMGTTIKERRSQIKLDKLASSLNIQYFNFKRNNFQKNFKTYKEVVQKCRKYRTPFICEFEVRTEGSYKKKNNLVKYHHGPMKLEMKNKFLLKDYKDDILYKISSKK
jgi:TPP-dependent pyruvate/acetoin dehydrogenase alpha subunit